MPLCVGGGGARYPKLQKRNSANATGTYMKHETAVTRIRGFEKKELAFIDGINMGKNLLKYNYFTITDGINIYATIIPTITDAIKLGHIYFHNISTIIFDLFFIPGIDCPLL